MFENVNLMQEAQAAGCHSSTEVYRYLDLKRKKETEVNGCVKESCDDAGNSMAFLNVPVSSDSIDAYSINLDLVAFSDAELLSAPVSVHFFYC